MGVYSTAAIVASILIYAIMRPEMRLYKDRQGFSASVKPTNFHAEPSFSRPFGGLYYSKTFENVYSS